MRACVIFCCFATPAVLLAQPDRITGIDPGRTVVTRGVVRPMALPRYDQGQVEASFRLGYIQMMLMPTAAQRSDLDRLLAAQQDPASPDFHKWLTPEQYADRFGVSKNDVAKIEQWLDAAGFSIEYTARGRTWIAFSGTAGQVQAVFQTAVHRFAVNGETHYAIASEPKIPAALEPLVGTLMGLDNFTPKPLIIHPAYTYSAEAHTLAPGDLATIYDLTPLYQEGIDGTGQSIAIVGQTTLATSDLQDIQTFRSTYGLNPANIQTVLGGTDPGMDPYDLAEADLDLEWSGAIARGADLIYVYATSADYAAFFAIDRNLAPIISESFVNCEFEIGTSYPPVYELMAKQANSQGITWLAGSGDSGAAGCDLNSAVARNGLWVSFPASVPEVTAVGGTEFLEGGGSYWNSTNGANGGSAMGYIPEAAWNDTVYGTAFGSAYANLNASGGGNSTFYPKPTWQSGPGVPADARRHLPDVAFAASADHNPYNLVISGAASAGGGTSAATPVFAGMLALLNQHLKGNGIGNVNTMLYSLAAKSPAVFHDISLGSNIVPCFPGTPSCVNGQVGFNAATGYDLATGLGSVDAYNLVNGWNGVAAGGMTILSLSPASIAAGGGGFQLAVNGSNFAAAAVVEWNGSPLPTTFVSPTQLMASVSASLVAAAGTVAITVSSGATVSPTLYFEAVATPATFSGQKVTTETQSALGSCAAVPAYTFLASDATAYVQFSAYVGSSDQLTSVWLAPDGATMTGTSWAAVRNSGTYCYTSAGLSLANVSASQYGAWFARVYDNGTLLFSIQFTVACTLQAAPTIASIDSASAYGGYPYFSSGSWLEIKGTNLADLADPRLTASTNPGQWTANDFNGANAPIVLDGVSVRINGKQAYVWYLSPGQLNVQAPEDTATGNISITVHTCKGTSTAFPFARQALAPGILAPPNFSAGGTQYMAATFASDSSYVLNTSLGATLGLTTRPAKPGDLIIAYGIGFGDVMPSILPGVIAEQSNTLNNAIAFSFGTTPAIVTYSGLTGNFVGLYEFYITVPQGLANGDYQINVTQNGTALPQTMYLSVHN